MGWTILRNHSTEGIHIVFYPTFVHSACWEAAWEGHDNIVKFLLEKGANVNSADANGRTLMHVAAQYARMSIVDMLLDKKADVNAMDNEGVSPLFLAVESGNREASLRVQTIKEKLAQSDENVEPGDKNGATALKPSAKGGKRLEETSNIKPLSIRENVEMVPKRMYIELERRLWQCQRSLEYERRKHTSSTAPAQVCASNASSPPSNPWMPSNPPDN